MTMIDRESAEKLLEILRTTDDRQVISGQAALEMLARVLARGVEGEAYAGPPLSKGKKNIDRLERFFDFVIQVAPPPPVPYTAREIALLARHSERETLATADEVRDSDDPEKRDMEGFYRSIASDYAAIAIAAENDWAVEAARVGEALKLFRSLDTADRGKFGWGSDIWDEARWVATTEDPFI